MNRENYLAELAKLMDTIHVGVFDKTIAQRRTESPKKWQDEAIDYKPV